MSYLSQKDLETLQKRFKRSTATKEAVIATIQARKERTLKPKLVLHENEATLDLEANTLTVKHKTVDVTYSLVNNSDKYTLLSVRGHYVLLHRLVWMLQNCEIPEGMEVDHIDRNKGNNHPSNLRLATKSENAQNRTTRSDNKLGVKGVSYDPPTGKYRAEITVNKKTIRLGRFLTLEAAVKARKDAEVLHHTYRVT